MGGRKMKVNPSLDPKYHSLFAYRILCNCVDFLSKTDEHLSFLLTSFTSKTLKEKIDKLKNQITSMYIQLKQVKEEIKLIVKKMDSDIK